MNHQEFLRSWDELRERFKKDPKLLEQKKILLIDEYEGADK